MASDEARRAGGVGDRSGRSREDPTADGARGAGHVHKGSGDARRKAGGGGSASRDEVVAALDALLGPQRFVDGQENGLQVEGKPRLARIALAVSVSQEVLDAAVAWQADALLTHHGLLWKNEPLRITGVRRRRLAALLAADMNVITYHLPLDAHPELGNNAALAELAGGTATPAFAHKGATVGMLAELPDPEAFPAWVARFEAVLRVGCDVATGPFTVWDFGPPTIRRIGFVSGAAPYNVHDAIDAGCDVFVTGEVTEGVYHVAKEAGIHFVAGGHYLTERLGVQRLGHWLAQRFGLDTRFFDVETLA